MNASAGVTYFAMGDKAQDVLGHLGNEERIVRLIT
jgi:hypothetical protein